MTEVEEQYVTEEEEIDVTQVEEGNVTQVEEVAWRFKILAYVREIIMKELIADTVHRTTLFWPELTSLGKPYHMVTRANQLLTDPVNDDLWLRRWAWWLECKSM